MNSSSTQRTALLSVLAVALLAIGLAAGYFLIPGLVRNEDDHDHSGETTYYCPMHPQVTSEEPGTCPICYMDLVPKGDPNAMEEHMDSEVTDGAGEIVHITPRGRVVADVATVEVGYRQLNVDITAPAHVEVNEATEKMVTAWYSGRIEKLFVDRTGDYVKKGEAIAAIYSPELINAQREYLIALDTRRRNLLPTFSGSGESPGGKEEEDRLVDASEERLKLMGMTEGQIGSLRESGKITRTTTFFSTASGIVTNRAVREGAYINEGTLMLEVIDLSSVWVVADIYETQINLVRPGMEMSVTAPSLGGDRIVGRIEYIYPMVDPQTRTIRVRGIFSNPGLRLKPGMYLTASLITSAVDALAVPVTAVIRTGDRDLVYVKVDERTFEAREVTLGRKADGYYQITGGNIHRGDSVVAEGGFLLDSERQLNSNTFDNTSDPAKPLTPSQPDHSFH